MSVQESRAETLCFDNTSTMWLATFQAIPGDPDELRIASDWLTDNDLPAMARAALIRAEFWEWVEENNHRPLLYSHRKIYGWRYHPTEGESAHTGQLPKEIYILLPVDVDGDISEHMRVACMCYGPIPQPYELCTNTEQSLKDTWQALFTAWLAWKEQCKK